MSILLDIAKTIVDRLYRQTSDYVPQGPAGCIVIILCETLQHAANEIYQLQLANSENFWRQSVWPSRRMLAKGW